jgi:alpha-beta hydrolase superfamily lysophospholipase
MAEDPQASEPVVKRRWIRRIVVAFASYSVVSLLAIFVAFLLGWASFSRSLPEPSGWHFEGPESEFVAKDAHANYTFDDYLAQEERVFRELDAFIDGEWKDKANRKFSRFNRASASYPGLGFDRNWNRTVVLEADAPKGGALLIHGLSDSPYSVRASAEKMHARGWTVIALRVPGHGTSPGALAEARWRDWSAAVRVAARGLRDKVPEGSPLILFGFSNGGALCVDYALDSLEDASLPRADGVVMYAPMIGITPFAKITRLHHLIAWIPAFEKVRWSSISEEIDPCKYSSWPTNASEQAFLLTTRISSRLAGASRTGRISELPPFLTFQSVVDSTVRVPDLMRTLYERLPRGESELVLFDMNRTALFEDLLNNNDEPFIRERLASETLPYRLTFVSGGEGGLNASTREGAQVTERALGMEWPRDVFSLSHGGIPVRPDDPVLGTRDASADFPAIGMGSLQVRGEHGVLRVSEGLIVRLRHNPFFAFVESETDAWLRRVVGEE